MRASQKYENTILYLCDALGGSVRGKKKLAKLLYYVDFDRYEYKESKKTLTGDAYAAWKMGPVPKHFAKTIDSLVAKKLINVQSIEGIDNMLPTEVYSSINRPDMSLFDDDEKFILARVVAKYGGLTGKQLEALTHSEAPFIATEQSKDMLFDLAFYRGTDFGDELARA